MEILKLKNASSKVSKIQSIDLKAKRRVSLGDIAGSVPDHHNKMNIAIKQITQTFWFLSAYKSYVDTILYSIKCSIALCLKESKYLN